ncbi:MAG TPA: phosphatase PAP2 family protein [Phenylobacterium sp.]
MSEVSSKHVEADWNASLTAVGARGFLGALTRELHHDRLLYLIVATYAAAALAVGHWLSVGSRIDLLTYMSTWVLSISAASMLYILLVELPAAIRSDPVAPLSALRLRLARYVTPRTLASLSLILALGLFMGVFTSMKTMLPFITEFSWDQRFAELDAAIHGGVDPWRLLHPALAQPIANRIVEFCYAGIWMMLTCGAAAWAAGSATMAPYRVRFLTCFMLAWILLGNLMAGAFFSAGPAFFEAVGGGGRYAELVAYHAAQPQSPTSAHALQEWLWAEHQAGLMQIGTGISAFPSMHVSMATMTVIAAFCTHRKLGYFALGYLVLILASSVHLGWHYAVDGYASILGTLTLWYGLGAAPRVWRAAQRLRPS